MKKVDREIMNTLEAFDLTGSAHSAAALAGCDPKTVRHWVARRDRGLPVGGPGRRERLIDPFLDKVEEWVDRSQAPGPRGLVHERLVAVGFDRDERTTRRGRRRQGQLAGRASAHLPAGDHRAGHVVPVRLGSWAAGAIRGRSVAGDAAVLPVAGVVTVPGGHPDLGPNPAHPAGRPACARPKFRGILMIRLDDSVVRAVDATGTRQCCVVPCRVPRESSAGRPASAARRSGDPGRREVRVGLSRRVIVFGFPRVLVDNGHDHTVAGEDRDRGGVDDAGGQRWDRVWTSVLPG